MPARDLFDKKFDEGTHTKLIILDRYFNEWLPVFVAKTEIIFPEVQIFDFFAGRGNDKDGNAGSPILLAETILKHTELIKAKNIKVTLHLNEFDKDNFDALSIVIQPYLATINIELYNDDFVTLFNKLYPSMLKSANFLFLDQNGIKQITRPIFEKITSIKATDFIFYISSSYFRRFAETPEFSKYFEITKMEVANTDYFHIHRKVLDIYKSYIPSGKKYYLAPFSIKKTPNIYGIIFGSGHTFGLEKFLNVAWKIDTLRGDSNYDIDGENINPLAPKLFAEFDKPTKRFLFETKLEQNILGKITTRIYDAYIFGLNEGFLLKDVNVILRKLKNERKINFDAKLISSDLHKMKPESSQITLQ